MLSEYRVAIVAILTLTLMPIMSAADLPSKKSLNLAAIKTMVAAAEAEARNRNVQVTICIVDDFQTRAGCPFRSKARP